MSGPTIGELNEWAQAHAETVYGRERARTIRTAVSRLHDNGLNATDDSAEIVAEALDISLPSATMYLCRARRAMADFPKWQADQSFRVDDITRESPVVTRLSFAAELQEAFVALGRWQNLRPYLLAGLAKAVEDEKVR